MTIAGEVRAYLGRKAAVWSTKDLSEGRHSGDGMLIPQEPDDSADRESDERDEQSTAELVDVINEAHCAVGVLLLFASTPRALVVSG